MAEPPPADAAPPVGGPHLLGRDDAEDIARSLGALADPTRLQLLSRIVESPGGRALVGGLADNLRLSQPTVSHHVRVMAAEGLLDRRPDGRLVWYSVAQDRLGEVLAVLRDAGSSVPPDLERIADDLAVRFRGALSRPTIDRYVRESYELLGARGGSARHLASLTGTFAGDRLAALSRGGQPSAGEVPRVLFVCVQNSGRSQLASAILRALAGDLVRVSTAGSAPAARVNPAIVTVLDEVGISLAGEFPKPLTDEVVRAADVVVTMGCGDACPVYPGRRYLDWDIRDPVGLPLDAVRAVRDDIYGRVRALLDDLTARGPANTG